MIVFVRFLREEYGLFKGVTELEKVGKLISELCDEVIQGFVRGVKEKCDAEGIDE
jgi:hypothetical protein